MTTSRITGVTHPTFPEGFWWGAATSAYQIEGAVDEGGRSPSIWDVYSHTPGKTLGGDTGDVAADHYHRLEEDVALMGWLGLDAYRFSIAWPRLIPDGVGDVNPAGAEFYRRLCRLLREEGIVPVATLYHWDLPQILQEQGGWAASESPEWFARYAEAAHQTLGDLVDVWATINEPWCAAFLGHSAGVHAPGATDPAVAHRVAHRLLVGHHRAAGVIKKRAPEHRVGIVLNLIPAWPAVDDPRDAEAADRVDLIQNRLFLEGALRGGVPDEVSDICRVLGVEEDPGELETHFTPSDYLGVNYYNVNRIAYRRGAPSPAEWPGADEAVLVPPSGPVTAMGWGIDPDGLTWMLRRVSDAYPDLPLFITENGAAFEDRPVGGRIDDQPRVDYLSAHVAAAGEAIEAGVDLRGYFVWSLLDNFEWSYGYSKTFGLFYVDRRTLDRSPKASAYWYRDLIRSGINGGGTC